MSTVDSAWILNAQMLASLGLHAIIELVFAVLALTLIRAYRPRGGLMLGGAILVGLVLTTGMRIAWPVAFAVADKVIGFDQYVWVPAGLSAVDMVVEAGVRIVQIGAIVAVAMDPGPIADDDDPPRL